MDRCDYCMYRYDCIGWIGTKDGGCAGFAISKNLTNAYEEALKKEQEIKDKSPFGF